MAVTPVFSGGEKEIEAVLNGFQIQKKAIERQLEKLRKEQILFNEASEKRKSLNSRVVEDTSNAQRIAHQIQNSILKLEEYNISLQKKKDHKPITGIGTDADVIINAKTNSCQINDERKQIVMGNDINNTKVNIQKTTTAYSKIRRKLFIAVYSFYINSIKCNMLCLVDSE